jgi:CheY-like chemotaxis protein
MILIVAGNPDLAWVWARHLERQGQDVVVTTSAQDAVEVIRETKVDVIVLDLMLSDGNPFSVADYASYRRPGAKIVFVTRTNFFSDGSLFRHVPNTAAILQQDAPPSDLAEIVAYHGRAS